MDPFQMFTSIKKPKGLGLKQVVFRKFMGQIYYHNFRKNFTYLVFEKLQAKSISMEYTLQSKLFSQFPE